MIIEWSSGCARATTGDRDFLLNQKPVLLLHCDGTDESATFTDSGGTGHTVTRQGTAQIDTAQSKFGGASGLFDGNSDYLTIPDHANWDLIGSATDNWTIDFWVKHTDHSGVEMYISQYEDSSNYWMLYHADTTDHGIRFRAETGGADVIDTGFVGEITDTDWHHIALIKIAAEYGIYKDGTQIGYVSDNSTDTYTASLYIGNAGGAYFDGWMDEIRIVKANVFKAVPVVGKTDTITVPSRPYMSWG